MIPVRGLAVPLLCLAAAGCVETGDFGRVKRSVGNEAIFATGAIAAGFRGEPVSLNMFTDDEEEMRYRSWRFLVPSRDRPWLDRVLAELVTTRLVPPDMIQPDRGAYFAGLLEVGGRSPASLYRRLSEDAAADAALVEPFAAVAARVLAADRRRVGVLSGADGVDPWQAGSALARVAENRCLVAWVAAASAFRASAYRYALEHMVIEAPQLDAVPTERAIARLAHERIRLDALGVPPLAAASCAGTFRTRANQAPPAIEAPAPAPVLVRKG